MTIHEAIHMLYSLKLMKEDDISDLTGMWYKGIKEDYDEALQMAIEALQQGCEKVAEGCDDLISRQQAINSTKYIFENDWMYPESQEKYVLEMLDDLPSANIDLSGFCDRLWRGAYDSGYERCRQYAIDALMAILDNPRHAEFLYTDEICKALNELPFAQPDLLDDGTLVIPVPNGMLNDVKRVMVDEVGTKFCKVMYQDAERKKGHWIKISPSCIYECSICHQDVLTPDIGAYEFCHHCGADMRGEEHETD